MVSAAAVRVEGAMWGGMRWTLDDIPWDQFDRDKVDADLVPIVKSAAMVEFNAADYVSYLEHVFADDPEFVDAARQWGEEERQHGRALSAWSKLVEPEFDFESRFQEFRRGFQLDIDVDRSIRGSRSGELVARCVVEVGTSSYYSALADGTEERVIEAICRRIAADELRHYKMFYDHLKRYLDTDRLNKLRRIRVAMSRVFEIGNDELSYAYYAANNNGEPYDRKLANDAYMVRAYRHYRQPHINRGISMIFKAIGLRPNGTLCSAVSHAALWYLQKRQRTLARQAGARQAGARQAVAGQTMA